MMFSYMLDGKQAFLDYQNIDFAYVTELDFLRELVHDFGRKVQIFSSVVFVQRKLRNEVLVIIYNT